MVLVLCVSQFANFFYDFLIIFKKSSDYTSLKPKRTIHRNLFTRCLRPIAQSYLLSCWTANANLYLDNRQLTYGQRAWLA